MQFDWQTICALIIVASAIVFVVRRQFKSSQKDGCGTSCNGCSANKTPLVHLRDVRS